jgi:hypothetical protein
MFGTKTGIIKYREEFRLERETKDVRSIVRPVAEGYEIPAR